MKFQIPNMHHSEVNGRTHTQTDRQTDKPKAICPSNFFKVGGIKKDFTKTAALKNECPVLHHRGFFPGMYL